MNYYLRQSHDSEMQGPFSLEDINTDLAAGKLSEEWLATADLGESLKRIDGLPAHDWTPLSKIPGTSVYSPAPLPLLEPGKSLPIGCHCLIWTLALPLITLAVLYASCSLKFR